MGLFTNYVSHTIEPLSIFFSNIPQLVDPPSPLVSNYQHMTDIHSHFFSNIRISLTSNPTLQHISSFEQTPFGEHMSVNNKGSNVFNLFNYRTLRNVHIGIDMGYRQLQPFPLSSDCQFLPGPPPLFFSNCQHFKKNYFGCCHNF